MIERSKCMNVPEIRFNDSQSEWSKKNFLSEVSIYSGLTYSPNDIRTQGTLVLRSSNVQEGNVSLNDNVYVNSFIVNSPNVQKGDIIIVVRNGSQSLIGKHAIIKQEMPNTVIGAFMTGLHCKNNSNFINALLSSTKFKKEIYKNLGATINQITNKTLTSMEFMFPKENDMYNIGCFFEKLDSLIQTTSKELASLKQIKAASLQSMFPQEGETVPKVRFKGFEGEWDKVKLSTLGQTYSGLTGKTKEDFNFGDSLYIPFLNVLLNPQIDESNLQKVRVENNEKQNEIHKGDILFNTSSETPEEVGLCSVFMSDIKKVYLNSFCFGFRLFNNLVVPSYIVYLLRSQIGRKLMLVLAQGATRYNLSKKSFLNAHIIIPTSQQEQQKIASYFCNLDKQLSLQAQRLEKLKQIKAACLDKMFV